MNARASTQPHQRPPINARAQRALHKLTTLAELRDCIAAVGTDLTPRALAAARYALDHPNDMALSPVAAVAAQSGIAASAFIRMSQALGFKGYGELQKLFIAPLHRAAAPSFRERIRHHGGEQAIADPADTAELLRAFSQANIVSLEHLRDEAEVLALDGAIELIRQARVVYVLGLRRSYAVAAYLAYALARVGRRAVHITGQGGAVEEQAGAAAPGDLLIAISFAPYAADTLRVCEQVRLAGARRLAITDTVLSPIAQRAECLLQVNDAELLGFRSLTSAMCLVQTLAMGLAFAERQQGSSTADANTPGGRQRGPGAALQDIDC